MSDRQLQQARGFLVPIRIVTAASRDGISLEELQRMVRLSARCTHELGNRRYHGFIFNVEGQRVTSFTRLEEDDIVMDDPEPVTYKCDTCKDTKRIRVFNVCHHCDGEGCKRCDEGLIPAWIPCPDCSKQKRRKARKY